jgi:DNA polymerase III delta prime subunit
MSILEHLDKNNLHHAYLIEGMRDEVMPEVVNFLNEIGIKTVGNSDFVHIHQDSFKIDDARNLKSFASEKSFVSGRRIFVVTANSFLLEAQNSLLKMFEEPIDNTHFFLIVPDINVLLRTLVSRFYLISSKFSSRQGLAEETRDAEKFIKMPLRERIDFIKELLAEDDEEDEEGNELAVLDSTRSKAIKFLNALEEALHRRLLKNFSGSQAYFEHFFKVREFLRMPGSSAKSLMESVALLTPTF